MEFADLRWHDQNPLLGRVITDDRRNDSPVRGEDHLVNLCFTDGFQRMPLMPGVTLVGDLHEPAGDRLVFIEGPADHQMTMCEVPWKEHLQLKWWDW